ncbi:MAG TPA: GNAT family N-acetyltransferase [Succinivibrionaceae bacterium]|nr:GNAT family N-acetyltransferase [Succinivibrionaceae bacterium]
MTEVHFRKACKNDCLALSKLEASCFPANEAASLKALMQRLESYPEHFLLMADGDRIIGMINGMCSNERDLLDEMYADALLHDEQGSWQMIFSVCVDPAYRKRDLGQLLIKEFIKQVKADEQRKGLVLTCHEHLVHWYAECGFKDEGICASEHGGSVWHQMRLTF